MLTCAHCGGNSVAVSMPAGETRMAPIHALIIAGARYCARCDSILCEDCGGPDMSTSSIMRDCSAAMFRTQREEQERAEAEMRESYRSSLEGAQANPDSRTDPAHGKTDIPGLHRRNLGAPAEDRRVTRAGNARQAGPEPSQSKTHARGNTSDQLTIGDLNHPVMRWSMYDTSSYDSMVDRLVNEGKLTEDNEDEFRETFCKAHLSLPLELDAPGGMDDGVYNFNFQYERDAGITYHGVVIRGGHFDPEMTAHAIYLAQVQRFGSTRFDHVYIESLTWSAKSETFMVCIGS